MQPKNVIHRFTGYSKIVKINIVLVISLVIAATIAISFANSDSANVDMTNAPATQCAAKVAIVLDRSNSIGVRAQGGSYETVHGLKLAVMDNVVQKLQGSQKYTDLFAFASVAERINGNNGWLDLSGTTRRENEDKSNRAIQVMDVLWARYKVSPKDAPAASGVGESIPFPNIHFLSADRYEFRDAEPQYWGPPTGFGEGDIYDDGLAQAEEGATNWEAALKLVNATHSGEDKPTHVIFFTDGNPTTHDAEVNAVKTAGGKWTGPNDWDKTEYDDIQPAVELAQDMREAGTKIIPVGFGSKVTTANLQALAGTGNRVFTSNNIAELGTMLSTVTDEICNGSTGIAVRVKKAGSEEFLDAQVKLTTTGSINSINETKSTSGTSTPTGIPWKGSVVWHPLQTSGNYSMTAEVTGLPNGWRIAPGKECFSNVWNSQDPAATRLTAAGGNNNSEVDTIGIAGKVTLNIATHFSKVMCQFIAEPVPVDNTSDVYVRIVKEGTTGVNPSDLLTGTAKVTTTGTTGGDGGTTKQTTARPVVNVDEFGGTKWGTFTATQPWGLTVEATAPTGYEIIATDACTHDTKTAMPESESTKLNHAKGSYTNVPSGVDVLCQFIARPSSSTTTTTAPRPQPGDINVRFVLDGTQNSSTPTFISGQVALVFNNVTQTSKSTSANSANPWATWDVEQNAVSSATFTGQPKTGYEYVQGAYCSQDDIENDPISNSNTTETNLNRITILKAQPLSFNKLFCQFIVKPTSTTSSTTTTTPATTTTTPTNTPKLEVVKSTGDVTTAAVGDEVRYFFTISNKGNVILRNVKVTDSKFGDLGTIAVLNPGEVYGLNEEKGDLFEITADMVTNGQVVNVVTACFSSPVVPEAQRCVTDEHTLTITQVAGTQVTNPPSVANQVANQVAGALAFTGSTSSSLAIIAAVILAAGVAIFLLARKKKIHHHE